MENKQDKLKVTEGMTNILSSMLDGMDIETMNHDIYKQLMTKPEIMQNPRYFAYASGFGKIKDAVKLAIRHSAEIKDPRTAFHYETAFFNHDNFTGHVRHLVTVMDGSACCADKAGTVVGQYLKFLRTGEKADWNPDNYWIPDFGTQEQWFSFVQGLCGLHHGNPEEYLMAYHVLFEAGLKDGAKVKYASRASQND